MKLPFTIGAVIIAAGASVASAVDTFHIDTYVGSGLPDGVPALETNVWVRALALGRDCELYVSANDVVRRIDTGGIIHTIGGTIPRNWTENDGGDALQADTAGAWDLVRASAGDVYYCDASRDVIRRIDPDGTVHTVAGQWGVSGSTGDGGPATEATVETPLYLTFGPEGDLYFTQPQRVRAIDSEGTIRAVAGTGEVGSGGEGDGGPAPLATFTWLQGLEFDAVGRLHLVDAYDSRIRRINLDGTIETVAGGNGTLGYGGDGGPATEARIGRPSDVAFDAEGNLLIADYWNGLLRMVDADGIIHTISGTGTQGYSGDGGPASLAQLGEIVDLEVDDAGNVYLVDASEYRIRRIDTSGIIDTIAGNGTKLFGGDGLPASEASFATPSDIAFAPSGDVFIADKGNYRIRRVDTTGIVSTYAGNGEEGWAGDGGPALEATLNPQDLALAPDGTLYVLQTYPWIRRITPDGIIHHVAGTGENGFSREGLSAANAKLNRPEDIFVAPSGDLYIADTDNSRIRVIDGEGIIRTIAGNGERSSTGDGGLAIDSTINRPVSVYVTEEGSVYISEASGHRVRRIDPDGIIWTVAGGNGRGFSGDGGPATAAQLEVPVGLYLDADGYLYIADSANYRVRRVAPDGTITTVAGTGQLLYNGDGIPATEANLRNPLEIVRGFDDVLYVTNEYSGRIRMLIPDTDVPIAFGGLVVGVVAEEVRLRWQARTASPVRFQLIRQRDTDSVVVAEWASQKVGPIEYVDHPGRGSWTYRVRVLDGGGGELATLGPVSVIVGLATPPWARIRGVWPNPANPAVSIAIEAPAEQRLTVAIYDVRGRHVVTLLADDVVSGTKTIVWPGTDGHGRAVVSGVYQVRLTRDGGIDQTRAVTILR